MTSLILRATARSLLPVLLLFSWIILYRGHNLPGGGFIGGLTAAAGFIIVGLSEDIEQAKRILRISPLSLMAVGLLTAALSGVIGVMTGAPFMTGIWLNTFEMPVVGTIHLGTPMLFDVGVYLAVCGFSLNTLFTLSETED